MKYINAKSSPTSFQRHMRPQLDSVCPNNSCGKRRCLEASYNEATLQLQITPDETIDKCRNVGT